MASPVLTEPALSSEADRRASSPAAVSLGGDVLTYTWARLFYETYGLTSVVLAASDAKAISASRFTDYRAVPGIDQEQVCLDVLREVGAKARAEGKVALVLVRRRLVRPYVERAQARALPVVRGALHRLCATRLKSPRRSASTRSARSSASPIPRRGRSTAPTLRRPSRCRYFSYPVIAKPSNSARYHYADIPNKKKVFTVENARELSTLFNDLRGVLLRPRARPRRTWSPVPTTTACAPSPASAMPTATCASGPTGRALLEDHCPTAVGNPVCILVEENRAIAEQAARFLKHVGYRGFSNFDVKYDPRDGQLPPLL